MTAETHRRSLSRFRGRPADARAQNFAAAMVVMAIAACGAAGIVGAITVLAFFAVGAGAGYSLSGSV